MRLLPLSLAMSLLLGATALAQVVPPQSGQVEQSLQKKKDPKEDPQAPKGKIEIQPRQEMKSEDDSKVRLKVERLKITGNKTLTEEELLKVAYPPVGVVGKEMTLAELKASAALVTSYYKEAGFGLAWAYIPVQDVKDGVVEIAVVEGRVDKILVSGNEFYSADFIIDHVDRIQKQSTLALDSLERGLMLLNSYPGLRVRSTLRQGDAPGTTDLYLTAEDKFPVGFSLDFDNYGPKSTGQYRLGGNLTLYDLFDEGHWITFRGVSTLDRSDGETTNGRVDYTVPFKDGSRVWGYASIYDYEAKGPVTILEPQGDGYVFGLNLSHPLIMNHTQTLNVQFGFEWQSLRQELLGIETAKDELRIASAGLTWELSDSLAGRWLISGDVHQGLGHVMGGLEEDDPDSSRYGADNLFTRLNLTLFRLQKITSWLHLIGKAQGQWTNKEVVVSQQFALGGQDSVRGYAPFDYMADRGYSGTLELRLSLPFLDSVVMGGTSLVDMIQLCGFIDSGAGSRINVQFAEVDSEVLTGAGAGVRLNYPDLFSVRFDVGWRLSDYETANDRSPFYYISVILNLH